jgi:hypothetical protein
MPSISLKGRRRISRNDVRSGMHPLLFVGQTRIVSYTRNHQQRTPSTIPSFPYIKFHRPTEKFGTQSSLRAGYSRLIEAAWMTEPDGDAGDGDDDVYKCRALCTRTHRRDRYRRRSGMDQLYARIQLHYDSALCQRLGIHQ